MRYVTREEVREIDRLAAEMYGVPVDTLMENAGRAVAEAVAERTSPSCPVVAVCGWGNNGGDGFVAARLLAERGYEVEVLALGRKYDPSTPTGRNWARARESLPFVDSLKRRPMAVLVDAIFGTGLARPVEGRERGLIEEMNALDRRWWRSTSRQGWTPTRGSRSARPWRPRSPSRWGSRRPASGRPRRADTWGR